jgi:16S rRNA processing protein RimM
MDESAYLIVGKIVGTHGIRGDLKVLSYAESLDVFAPGKQLVFSRGEKSAASFTVTSCRQHKKGILLAIDGITSIETAKPWVGCEVCTEKASLPPPEEGVYYWYQIIGLKVRTTDGVPLGHVKAIFPTGSNDVYVVHDGKKEVLIPAIETVVLHIDENAKVMTVDLPEGLED